MGHATVVVCGTLLFVAALPAIFQATKDSRVLNWLGHLSYPVYLVHLLLVNFAGPWIKETMVQLPYLKEDFGLWMIWGGSIAAAILARYLLEIPISKLMYLIINYRRQLAPAE